MRVYLGAPTKQANGQDLKAVAASQPTKLRLLLSYHYYAKEDISAIVGMFNEAGIELDMFADSGAFSAFTQGKTLNAADYTDWVKKWGHLFSAIAGPDVIGDAEKTKTATLKMRAVFPNKPILPCFHVGDDWSFLDWWCNQEGAEYIALGGMVPYTRRLKFLASWLNKAFTYIPKSTRVHGFGLTTWPLLLRYPWYSVDSSSWTSGFRYAQMSLFDARRGKFVQIAMNDRKSLMAAMPIFASYGVRAPEARADKYDRDLLVATAIRSWQAAEKWLGDVKKSQGHRDPHIHLVTVAGSAPNAPSVMLPALEKHK